MAETAGAKFDLTEDEMFDDDTLLSMYGVAALHGCKYGVVRYAILDGSLPSIPVVSREMRVTTWVVRMKDALQWSGHGRRPVGRPVDPRSPRSVVYRRRAEPASAGAGDRR